MASPTKAKAQSAATERAHCLFFGGWAMRYKSKTPPISVEIVAQYGRKFRVRLRLGLTIGITLVLISAVIKLLG